MDSSGHTPYASLQAWWGVGVVREWGGRQTAGAEVYQVQQAGGGQVNKVQRPEAYSMWYDTLSPL